jgi:phosphate transport system substrate-binding protein
MKQWRAIMKWNTGKAQRVIWLAVLVAMCAGIVDAAVMRINLNDGKALVGEVISFAGGIYVVQLQSGERVKISEKEVKSISYDVKGAGAAPPPPADLRFAGSNTVGERLVPELLMAYLTQLGAHDLRWQDNQPEDERRLAVGDAVGKLLPRSVQVAAHGTGTGFPALQSGEAEVAMASRQINDQELIGSISLGDLRGVDSEHTIALDGLAVIVHSTNRVSTLSTEQLAKVFSCALTDWSQIGGAPGAIHLYARDNKSGTFDTFKHFVLDPYKAALCAAAKRFESSTELSSSVAADTNGIGFIGLPYILNARALRVRECDLAYDPSPFAVKSEEYPLARRLYLYTPEKPASKFVGDFVQFALSDAGQQVAQKEGFVSQEIAIDSTNTQEARLAAAGLSAHGTAILHELLQTTLTASRLSVTFRFHPGSERLDTKALRDVDRLARFMRTPASQGKSLLLLGFADNHGSYRANEDLSRRRAEAVAKALRGAGVTVAEVRGFGEEAPVACNTTPAGSERNRHVEVWLR